jgi:hypothetical protein
MSASIALQVEDVLWPQVHIAGSVSPSRCSRRNFSFIRCGNLVHKASHHSSVISVTNMTACSMSVSMSLAQRSAGESFGDMVFFLDISRTWESNRLDSSALGER